MKGNKVMHWTTDNEDRVARRAHERALRRANGEPDPWRRWLSDWWPTILFEIFAVALAIGVVLYGNR